MPILMPGAKFAASFHSLEKIRNFVTAIARQAGLSESDVYMVQLATDEACTNIIEYAYDDINGGEIDISCNIVDDDLIIEIRDWGKSFDPSGVPEPRVDAKLSKRRIGGLGMYLMRKAMDKVTYRSSSQGGNVLTLVKRKG